MSDNILQRFRDKFIDEAIGLLDSLEKDLLELEKTPDEKELLESAFRAMHTLKGVSGMYGFVHISDFTHWLESIYQSLRDKIFPFSKSISDISFEAIDHIRKMLDDENLTNSENQQRHSILMEKIKELAAQKSDTAPTLPVSEAETAKTAQKQSWYIILHTNEQIFYRGVSLTNIFSELSQLGEFQIQQIPVLNDANNDSWGIVLVSDCSLVEIQEVFMFIEDDCQIFRITSDNIFELATKYPKAKPPVAGIDEPDTPSIMDLIEAPGGIAENFADSKNEDKNTPKKEIQIQSKQPLKRISVDAQKLDHLMYLVSELITVNSQLMLASHDKRFEELRPHIENVDALSKKFRNNALDIRLVPLSDIALRFQRLIRDLSFNLGKKVEFKTSGVDTELDKSMIDMLAEPLMHIIRNCIDHGIEEPDKRRAQGKAESGIIRLSASQSGNHVFIEISDDGNGIDTEKVRQKAIDKGIIGPNDKPGEKEIFDFIFLPGFSTAKSLTEVSGRGVGMDVVKKKIADLRGEILIKSTKGQGTSFILKLQQSVAIIDTLLFRVEDTHLLVPMSEIQICIQEDAEKLQQREHMGTIAYGEQMIQFVNLRKRLDIAGKYKGKVKIIIVKKHDNYLALFADAIIGEHQAVLKSMGPALQEQKCLMAASQLGNGSLSFMLDTATL